MNRNLGIVVLIAGIVLLVYGFSAMDSVSSSVSRLFNGAPSNKSIGLLLAGAVLSAWGALSVFRRGER